MKVLLEKVKEPPTGCITSRSPEIAKITSAQLDFPLLSCERF